MYRSTVCASVGYGQERDQLDEADAELPRLDSRGVHAVAVCCAGPLCVEALLGARHKKCGPIAGATFQRGKLVGDCQERRCKLPLRQPERQFGKRFEEKRVRVIVGCGLFSTLGTSTSRAKGGT